MTNKVIDINSVAMNVILNAGNAREYIDDVLEKMASLNFSEADDLLILAEKEIIKAHNFQTEIIQKQAAGENMEYSLLFIHAQDTVMTINTELRMTRKMLPIFRALYDKSRGD